MAYTIGVDYGTGSVRALVVRCADGAELGSYVYEYPSGQGGVLLDPGSPHLARQNPADYLEGLETTITEALKEAAQTDSAFSPGKVVGIGVDTTGSSPIPVDGQNHALYLREAWKGNLNAACWLWKDHTSTEEADRITALAREHRPEYVAKCGNTYSSEWFWAKIWRCLNVDEEVFTAAYSWVELCDWIPSVLAGIEDPKKIARGVCAAGHKAFYAEDWNGLPDKEFLALLDPRIAELRDRLYDKAYDASATAGSLCAAWAKKTGLSEGIPIAIGEMDVHYGAIGAGVGEGTLVKVIGTSTCDCAVVSAKETVADIPGICGIVKGAILPDYYGVEAGQSAVGDIFNWYVKRVCADDDSLHHKLTEEADRLKPGESGLLALDWNNGNRTILVDQRLSGLLVGQTLATTQAEIYRALIEGTAFGARMILDRLQSFGIQINTVVCAGGIAEKNPMLMQIYADVLGRDMRIAKSVQTCALGSAISASVAAGAAKGGHDSFEAAQAVMGGVKDIVYHPKAEAQAVYDQLFAEYTRLHDSFGGVETCDLGKVMKNLLRIAEEARA
jgi:L-ribulokinase